MLSREEVVRLREIHPRFRGDWRALNYLLDGGLDLRCADLFGADLRRIRLVNADLRDANLCMAELYGAILCHSNLERARLRGANLREADLQHSNLRIANLTEVDLRGTNLREADLSHSSLVDADLRRAILQESNLERADLSRADLRGANLRQANFTRAQLSLSDLRGANLEGTDFCGAVVRTANVAETNLQAALTETIEDAILSAQDNPPLDSPLSDQPARDPIQTSVFSDKQVRLGEWFTLSIWIHLKSDSKEVQESALELGKDTLAGRTRIATVPEGTLITLSLEPKFLQTSDDSGTAQPTLTKHLVWDGTPSDLTFIVKCPGAYSYPKIYETILIRANGVPLGELTIEIWPASDVAKVLAKLAKFKSAFASYARVDAEAVIPRLQTITKLLPDLDLFWDVEGLRSGDKWRETLAKEITSRDRFYLFWSANAAVSQWVEAEWRLALSSGEPPYIDPFPLDRTPPPEELSSLQFNDKWVRHLEFERMIHRQNHLSQST